MKARPTMTPRKPRHWSDHEQTETTCYKCGQMVSRSSSCRLHPEPEGAVYRVRYARRLRVAA